DNRRPRRIVGHRQRGDGRRADGAGDVGGAAFELGYFRPQRGDLRELIVGVRILTRTEIITQSKKDEGEDGSQDSGNSATRRHSNTKFGS
ncbi:MAG TPA: hypothetical protein VFJ02_16670, partial [Vicinamibacterales bacterium]|nr:hypothetical protein [Vicinamibacterales bacterium]